MKQKLEVDLIVAGAFLAFSALAFIAAVISNDTTPDKRLAIDTNGKLIQQESDND